MSTQKKENAKKMPFLTPQTQKISSKSNLSFSSNSDPKYLFENLMKDPVKRALFMEVISQDSPSKKKILNRKQKFKYESPSALCRRRALEKMEPKDDLMNNSFNTPKHKKKPLEYILQGVVAYVEIMNNTEDRSTGVKILLQAMGADVRDVLNKEVTHVVFKDGSFKTYQKAALLKAHLVSVLWLEAVRRNQYRVPEKDYPALGSTTPTANISLICQQFQKDYEDILQEELQRNKSVHNLSNINSNMSNSEDVIDSSQNYDIKSIISAKQNSHSKSPSTPNSLYLDNTSDLASDLESDPCLIKSKNVLEYNDELKGRQSTFDENINEKINCDFENEIHNDNDLNNGNNNSCNSNNNSIRNLSNSNKKSLESGEFSSLRISTESISKSDKQSDTPQKILLCKNITERSNRRKGKCDIKVVDMIVIKPSTTSPNKNYFDKEQSDVENTGKLDKKNRKSATFVRKLYSVDDDILDYDLDDKVSPSKDNTSSGDKFVKVKTKNRDKLSNLNSSKAINHEISNLSKHCLKTPRNSKNLDLKEPIATQRRKSTRLIKSVSKELLGKKLRNSDDEDILEKDIENPPSCKRKLLSLSKTFHEKNPGSEDEFLQISFNTKLSNNQKSIDGDKESNSNSQNRNSLNISNQSKHVLNVRNTFAVPRRKSTRLMKNEINEQSPQKELKRYTDPNIEGNLDSNIERGGEDSNKEEKAVEDRKSCNVDSMWDVNKKSPTKKLRRSTLDFISKETTKSQKSSTDTNTKTKSTQHSKSVKKASIVCTRFHNTEVQVFQQIVKKLGVFFVEDEVTNKTTHLVAAEARRTVNLLRAMARGCWIIKSEWLYKSLEADCWLPEEDYELCEFSSAVQKARQERQAFGLDFSMDIFKNCGQIYISKQTNPRCSDLQELATLCKGTVTTIVRNADVVVGEYIENKLCVTVYWIMDSITFYKRRPLKNYLIEPPSSD